MKLKMSEITVNPDNPRTIQDDKFAKLVQSIKDFPEMAAAREIIVNKDHVILGGNMRFRAMQEAGWTEVEVKVVDWPKEKQQEFMVKDNIAFGDWDYDKLANQFEAPELELWGMDLPGYSEDEDTKEDEAPELEQGEALSRLGEIYQLGKHRVMCGDATKIDDVEKLMGGGQG